MGQFKDFEKYRRVRLVWKEVEWFRGTMSEIEGRTRGK